MWNQKRVFGLSSVNLIILLAALVKFSIHLYIAPGYGFFGDELYTIALSKHLAFGYVDLPPLVPALVAFSRALLGESLFAMHIVPALAGAFTLVLVCLITKEFGGKTFAVALSALGFIAVPIWLSVDSIFCYDSIDQLILAGFLYTLVRFLRTGNQRLWIVLGLIAGIACMTKMTLLFMGPGFLVALLISNYRRDLLTPWPWLGAALCLIIVSPYLLWQFTNHWPTLEYWQNYGAWRVYQASLAQYLINIIIYMGLLLLPIWVMGLYRIFRRLDGVDYSFLGVLFAVTLALMFILHASTRMLAALFMPLLAAAAVLAEEWTARMRLGKFLQAAVVTYLLVVGFISVLLVLPILPIEGVQALSKTFRLVNQPVKEFNGQAFSDSPLLSGRIGYEELVQDVATVYNGLSPQDRAMAGIYTDWYAPAGAIDLHGPQYGLPHAVSGSLTYYLWGPGYSWEVMIIVADRSNELEVFFEDCQLAVKSQEEYAAPIGRLNIYVCRKPKVSADAIWSSLKLYR